MTQGKAVVEVDKKPNENNTSLLRRFGRKVYDAGVLPKAKGTRYHARDKSDFIKKKDALRRLEKRAEYERLYKLGKIKPRKRRR